MINKYAMKNNTMKDKNTMTNKTMIDLKMQ